MKINFTPRLARGLISLLFVAGFAFAAQAQERTISGTVTSDESNEGLPGVNVVVKATTIGTVTDIEGNYRLQVSEGENTLQFSFIGYVTKEVEAGNQSIVDVSLASDLRSLEEVVVTALGIEREERALGYSISEIDGSEVANSGEINPVQGLAGKVAGVQVTSTGGVPGASSKILIRGNSSFTRNNEPLFVVDGVPIDNGTQETSGRDNPFNSLLSGVNYSNRAIDINPQDIASYSVLKGPAAAALYGVRAANGAVIITTKKGANNQAPTVSVSSSVQVDRVNRLPNIQQVYAQGNGGGNQTGETPTFVTYDFEASPEFSGDLGTPNVWGPRMSTVGITPTDNMGEFFRDGITLNNSLSFAAGNENSSLRVSFGQLETEGIVPETDFSRYSARISAQTSFLDKVQVFGSFNYIQSGGTRAQNGSNISGVMLGLTRAPSSFDLAAGYELPNGNQRGYYFIYDNPYWTVNKNPFTDNVSRALGNFSFKYDIVDWLNLTYRVGTDFYTDRRKGILAIGSRGGPGDFEGEINENTLYNKEVYQDVLLTADKTFGKMRTSLTLGNNLNDRRFSDLFARSRFLSVPNFYNLGNGSDLYTSKFEEVIRTAALFFSASFSYDETIFVDVTGRNEWSSTFGPENNNFFYPSVSSSFVFTELFQDNDILSFGKLRLAYAQSGNSPAAYSFNTFYTSPTITDGFTDGLSFPYLGQNGFGRSARLGNLALAPERVVGYEAGLDLRFFNGRLTTDFTVYLQRSEDILLNRPLAASTGFQSITDNSGTMENRGIELLVNAEIVRAGDFSWNASLNFGKNVNKVTNLAEGVDELSIEAAFGSIGAFAIKGEPYGAFFGTAWEKAPDGQLLINPDTGLPFIAAETQGVGNPYPDWIAGFRNTFSYKGLTLTALLDIRQGGDVYNGTRGRLLRLGQLDETIDRERNYVVPGVIEGTDGSFRPNDVEISAFTYFTRFEGDQGGTAEQFVQDGSWVRLREVGLSYTFPKLAAVEFLDNLQLSITGRNLLLFTEYDGIDPETSLTGAGSQIGGLDYFNMPNTASVNIGLNATFR
ncbi:MAG: SusC/RagA family TonB-linked outer membrane protein [Tunicatimonas sp.]